MRTVKYGDICMCHLLLRKLILTQLSVWAGADPEGLLRRFDFNHITLLTLTYYNYITVLILLTYSDRHACANSEDADQTPQNAASDQGLHCLPLT